MNEQAVQDRWDVELEDAKPPKSGVPIWVWGCGGGCLLFLVIALVGTFWFAGKMVKMFGPEAAWPVVAEVMPYTDPGATEEELVAARPPGYEPVLIPIGRIGEIFGEEAGNEFAAGDDASLDSMIFLSPGPDPSSARGTGLAAMIFVFDGVVAGDPIDWVVSTFEFKNDSLPDESGGRSRLEFQGRETDAWHLRIDPQGSSQDMLPGGGDVQSMLFLDATGDRTRTVVIATVATGEVDATLDGMEELLLPFDVWAGR